MMTNQSNVRARWYLLALVPIAIGAGIAVVELRGMLGALEHMQRVVVPGKGEVVLEAGDHVAYGEMESRVGGTVYVATALELRCTLVALPGGEPVALAAPSSKTTYNMGAFSGQSMFSLTAPHAGTYQMTCEGEGGPATLAFGRGIGTAIITMVVGMMGGIIAALIVALLVRRRRRQSRVASQTPAPL